ncbi:CheR family methyltransferase [Chitinimonas sp. PSY-7]|uniref:CheR family methyltransferase n=1 Tax=Chitinimonas sp. PSY-7 TaxID=3459088 RepID=UPI00403FE841
MQTIERRISLLRDKHIKTLPILVEQIAAVLGLDFSDDRMPRLEAALVQAQRDGLTIPCTDPAVDATPQLIQLLPYLVVGETYFQRDLTPHGVIGQTILQPLLQRRRESKDLRLRFWNTACCTGEEAYTLLFCLDSLLGEDLANWQLELLATDLNPNFIRHAKTGRYSEYPFRQNEAAWRARYFVPDGRFWQVAPAWRDHIRFCTHNLAGVDYQLAGKGNFDLILCRNALMYLTPTAIQYVLRQLQARLAPEGRLLLSAAEAGLANNAGFYGELLGLSYAIGPATSRSGPSPGKTEVVSSSRPPPKPVKHASRHHRPLATQANAAPPAHEQDNLSAYERCLQRSKQLADQGQLTKAEASCRQAMQLNPLSSAPYWLLALVHDAAGQYTAALQQLQKLSYLEPGFVLAPYLEAQIHLRLDQVTQARRACSRCLQLLAKLDDSQLVPFGDGMSVAQLRQLCLALEAPNL